MATSAGAWGRSVAARDWNISEDSAGSMRFNRMRGQREPGTP
jgi:hypothetical protein